MRKPKPPTVELVDHIERRLNEAPAGADLRALAQHLADTGLVPGYKGYTVNLLAGKTLQVGDLVVDTKRLEYSNHYDAVLGEWVQVFPPGPKRVGGVGRVESLRGSTYGDNAVVRNIVTSVSVYRRVKGLVAVELV